MKMKYWNDKRKQTTKYRNVVENNKIKQEAYTENTYERVSTDVCKESAIDVAKWMINDLQIGCDGLPDEIVIRSRKASDAKMTQHYDELFRNNFLLIPRIKYIGIEFIKGEALVEAILNDKHATEKIDYFIYANIMVEIDKGIHRISIKLPYVTPMGEVVLGGKPKPVINIVEDVIITSSPYKTMFKLSRSKLTVEKDIFRLVVNGKNKSEELYTSNGIFNRIIKGEPYKGKHPLGLVKLFTCGLYNISDIPWDGTYQNGYRIQNKKNIKVEDPFYLFQHTGSLNMNVKFKRSKDIEMETYTEEVMVDGKLNKITKQRPKTKFEDLDSRGEVIKKDGKIVYKEYDLYTVNRWSRYVNKNVLLLVRDKRGVMPKIPEFKFDYTVYVPKGTSNEDKDIVKSILYLASIYPEATERFLDAEVNFKDGRTKLDDIIKRISLTKERGMISKITNGLVGALFNNFDIRTRDAFKLAGYDIQTFDDLYSEVIKSYDVWLGQSKLVGSRLSPMYSLTFPYASYVNNVFRNMSIGLNENDKTIKYIDIISRLQRNIGYGKPLAPLKNKSLLCMVETTPISDNDVRTMWSFESQESANGVYEQTKNGGVNTRPMPTVFANKTPEVASYIAHSMLKKTSGIPLCITPYIRLNGDIIEDILPQDINAKNTFLYGLLTPHTRFEEMSND